VDTTTAVITALVVVILIIVLWLKPDKLRCVLKLLGGFFHLEIEAERRAPKQ